MVDEGITTLKVKVGVDAARDIELVERLRKTLGPKVKLRVDANQGYRTWKEALRVTRTMAEYDIVYMEQPCEGLENMARVAQSTDVPIMADESAWSARDVLRLIEWKAAEMVSVYYTKPGGLMKSKKLLAVAETGGLLCDINGSGEMGIGNAANLHLAASSSIIELPGTIPVTSTAEIVRTKVAGHKYLDDIIKVPFEYRDGCLLVPDGPGLGIEVDEAKLEEIRAVATMSDAHPRDSDHRRRPRRMRGRRRPDVARLLGAALRTQRHRPSRRSRSAAASSSPARSASISLRSR